MTELTGEPSDAAFSSRALARLPVITPTPGFEAALLAAYENGPARRSASLLGALRAFCDLVWPGAPGWALAGGFAASLLLGVALGAVLPSPGEDAMAFSLDQTPGFALLSSDSGEDM